MQGIKTKLSAMMFLEWFIWGAWFVPLWQYLNNIGFSTTQIAWCYSSTAISAIVSPVFVGVVADRYFSAQKILAGLHIAGAILLLALTQQKEFEYFFPLLLVYALLYMPTVALTNSIAFKNLDDVENGFPRVRVLGTIGWIISGVSVGFIPSLIGMGDISTTSIPFVVAAAASLALGIYSLKLPDTPATATSEPVRLGELVGLDAIKMLKDRAFLIFVVCSFLFSIPLAFYYQFANGYLSQVGMENATGWMSLGQFSEIFFMLSLPLLLKRFSIKKVLLLGLLTAALRYLFFMFGDAGSLGHYALLFGGILLHGASYDFYFVTAYIYADRKAPAHMRAAAQGFLTLVCMGFGSLVGNQIGGRVLEYCTLAQPVGAETFDWFTVWGIGLAFIVVVTVLFVALFSEKDPKKSKNIVGAISESI